MLGRERRNCRLLQADLASTNFSGVDIMEATKKQVGGNHYQTAIQPIEYILANKLEFCEGNIVKYATRWREKGGVEDLRKIKHYCDFLIERELES